MVQIAYISEGEFSESGYCELKCGNALPGYVLCRVVIMQIGCVSQDV
jgi:hypothetical protein